MKRSEMCELMVATMLDNLPDLDNINSLDIIVYMDTVLEAIEEAGMLPPPKEHEFESFQKAKEGHGFAMVSINRFKWEPEDEA